MSLVKQISKILKSKAKLLENFSTLLKKQQIILICTPTTLVEPDVQYIVIVTPSEGHIHPVSSTLVLPLSTTGLPVNTTSQLRLIRASDDFWSFILLLDRAAASCVMQLLQMVCLYTTHERELDIDAGAQDLDNELSGAKDRHVCWKYLRKIAQTFQILPPSFYLHDIKRVGDHPVCGGGFAVSSPNNNESRRKLNSCYRISGKDAWVMRKFA